jgi:transaldolase
MVIASECAGWLAARPSGTENIYKIHAGSFKDQSHPNGIASESEQIVSNAFTVLTSYPRGRTVAMKATQLLHNLGQSIWLDNITRDLLNSGTLKRYVAELSVTGLTSNPTIFDHSIKNSNAYDAATGEKLRQRKSGESLFFELALEDLTRAAALFRPIYDQTSGVDGWVSLEVLPLLTHNGASTLAAAKDLHTRAGRPNLFIKIPGTEEGLPAIEEAIFAGVPINVTLCSPASNI